MPISFTLNIFIPLNIITFFKQRGQNSRSESSVATNAGIALILPLVIAGCGDSKVSQCNQLIEKVNATEQTLGNITQSSPPDINALQDIANATSKAQQDLETINLQGNKLNKLKNSFSEFYADISTEAQVIVNAYEAQNMRDAEEAYTRLETTFETQETLVEDINTFCNDSYND